MTDFWRVFLMIGGGIIFTASVLDSVIRWIKAYREAKQSAGEQVDSHIKKVLNDDRKENCPFVIHHERDVQARQRELDMLKESIINEIKPILEGLEEVRTWNKRMHHAIMTDLQIKLLYLYNNKFEKKGVLSKADQTNWDKFFSDYTHLGGNSDIKRMDEIIQKARLEATLGKARDNKKETDKEGGE